MIDLIPKMMLDVLFILDLNEIINLLEGNKNDDK